jgi:WD40 repeat protein
MGRVYAARQVGLGRIVALKAISVGPGTLPEIEMRFLREAQTIARLRHPHIVGVHDSGRADGCVYFSMDYIESGDLATRIRGEALGYREAAVLMHKVAGALAYAHGQGVIHRDLKPSNILMDGSEPKLADFGLAAELEAGGDLTRVTSILGTPHYLAPEAISGGSAALGVASDIYALGVVLFQLLTGRTPFAGASPAELPALVAGTEPPAPRLLAPAVPRDLETICLKCLERDPGSRYASAIAFAEDLRLFLEGEPIVARPVSGVGRFLRWCRRRPALAAVWLLLLTLAIGSTAAAGWIARARAQTVAALLQAHAAEAATREQIREAKLAEARAVLRTNTPGRRDQALAALAEAARIRPGPDLRDEAASALVLPDVRPVEVWARADTRPASNTPDPHGTIVAVETGNALGSVRNPADLHRWGRNEVLQHLDTPGTRAISPLHFSLDGRMVMGRYLDRNLRVWRVGTARPILTLNRPLPTPDSLVWDENDDCDLSPDGTWLALGLPGPGGLTLNRVADGGELGRWVGGEKFICIRVSPDARHVAAMSASAPGHPGAILLFGPPSCRLEETIRPGIAVNEIAWSADSRLLAVALGDESVAVYDRHGGRLIRKLSMSQPGYWNINLIGKETFLVEHGGGLTVHLVPIDLWSHSLEFEGIGPGTIDTDPASDTFVMGTLDNRLTRWQVLHPAGWLVMGPPRQGGYHFGTDGGLDFSPDGRWLASGHTHYTVVRDSQSGRLGTEIDSGVRSDLDFGSSAFTVDGRSVLRVSPVTGVHRSALADDGDGGLNPGRAEALDPETGYSLAAVSRDRRQLLLANLETGAVKVDVLDGHGATVRARWRAPGAYNGAFSPDGRTVVINPSGEGTDRALQRLRVYRTADGSVIRDLGTEISCDVDWSRDGRTVLTSNGAGKSIVWDATTWRPRLTLAGQLGGNATTFALSPDASYAVIAGGSDIHFVSMADGATWLTIRSPDSNGFTSAVRFSPDGRRVAVLWAEGRVDMIEPEVIRRELGKIGLGW